MKHINIYLEDKDFNALKIVKGNMTWHDFLLKLLDYVEDPIDTNTKEVEDNGTGQSIGYPSDGISNGISGHDFPRDGL